MMNWSFKSKRMPIGIDVGVRSIKAVQLSWPGREWQVEAVASIPRTGRDKTLDQDEVSRLAAVLDRQGFIGSDTVLAVPNEMLIGGIFELPSRSSGAPLDQIARMEIARVHKRDPGSFEMSSWDLPVSKRSSDTTNVMVAACAHADADGLLNLFDEAGLNVVALDTASWSFARACVGLVESESGACGILDLGWSSARLIVLYRGTIIYERTVPDGGVESLQNMLMQNTGLDNELVDHLLRSTSQEEAGQEQGGDSTVPRQLSAAITAYVDPIAKELETSLSYAAHRYQDATVECVALVGGGACVAGVSEEMAKVSNLPVRQANLGELAQCSSRLAKYHADASLTNALGLSAYFSKRPA